MVFQSWLEGFSAEMHLQNHNMLMLVDNVPSHVFNAYQLSNVTVEFLDPNMTLHIQPMDARILTCFKLLILSSKLSNHRPALEKAQSIIKVLADSIIMDTQMKILASPQKTMNSKGNHLLFLFSLALHLMKRIYTSICFTSERNSNVTKYQTNTCYIN